MADLTLELELPARLDAAEVPLLLQERLRVEVGRSTNADRVLLDTFDARLRSAGLSAEWPARPTANRVLTVRESGAPVRRAEVANTTAVGTAALPPGPVRERLTPVLGERALLPVARLRSRELPLAVVNGDGKTVVRLVVERPAVVRERTTVPLAVRVQLRPVRGYEQDFERTVGRLRGEPGFIEATTSLFDAAVTAAGGRPEGVSSKVQVELEPGTRADVAAGLVLTRLAESEPPRDRLRPSGWLCCATTSRGCRSGTSASCATPPPPLLSPACSTTATPSRSRCWPPNCPGGWPDRPGRRPLSRPSKGR